jgi:hypothetical protein
MYIGYSFKVLMKLEFSRQILENTQTSKLIKIRPVGAELFNADTRMDRQTDMKLIVAFRNTANAPNKLSVMLLQLLHNSPLDCTLLRPV